MRASYSWSTVGKERRINLAQDLARQLPWLKGKVGIDVWILTLEPGRYRIIPNSDFEGNEELKAIVERITATHAEAAKAPFDGDLAESAVLPSRLLRVTISPGDSWRLNLSSVPLFDATGEQVNELVQFLVDGYIELWSGLRFAQAQTTPIGALLR